MTRHGRSLAGALLWISALGIAAAAAYLMLAPRPTGAEMIPPIAAHFLLYFAQALVTIAAASNGRGARAGARTPLFATVGVVVYATALELGQAAVPERQAEVADLVANLAGAGAGLGAWHLLRARVTR